MVRHKFLISSLVLLQRREYLECKKNSLCTTCSFLYNAVHHCSRDRTSGLVPSSHPGSRRRPPSSVYPHFEVVSLTSGVRYNGSRLRSGPDWLFRRQTSHSNMTEAPNNGGSFKQRTSPSGDLSLTGVGVLGSLRLQETGISDVLPRKTKHLPRVRTPESLVLRPTVDPRLVPDLA